MPAPTHCLLIAALVLSIISWIAGIIALASPEWYVIDSTDGKTRIGAFKLCYPDSSGSEVCENAASKSFSFPECDRSSSELSSRFGVVQGLGIAGIILAVLATAVLVAATVRGCQRTRVEEEAGRRRLRNEPGYMPTPTNGGRPGQGGTQQNDSTSSQEITELDRRVPRLDIIAAILLLLSIAVYCASCFYFLQVITAWLFCDEKPCTYLTSTGTAGCTDGMGWTFALIIIAWIAGLIALMAIGFRWFLRPPTEEGISNGDSNGSQTNNTNHHRAVPSNDEEMRSRQPPRQKEQPPAAVASNSGPTHAPTIISTINPMLNVTNDNTASRATSSAAQQQQSSSSPFRARKPGEPVCDLPEGNWDWDESSQLFWSEEQQYFWDHNSGHFYEPESGQWFDPVNDKWYSL